MRSFVVIVAAAACSSPALGWWFECSGIVPIESARGRSSVGMLSDNATFRLLDAPVFPSSPELVAVSPAGLGMGAMLQRTERVCQLNLVPAWMAFEVECHEVPWVAVATPMAPATEAPCETRVASMIEPRVVPESEPVLAVAGGSDAMGASPEPSLVDAIRFRDAVDVSSLFAPSASRALAALN